MRLSGFFTHLSIRTKLVIAFLSIGLIPALILGGVSLVSSTQALEQSAINQIHASLSAKTERIRDLLHHSEKDLELLSQSPSVITFVQFYPGNVVGKNNINRMLINAFERVARGNPLYRRISLFNEKGEQVFRLDRRGDELITMGQDQSLNVRKAPFFWRALDTNRGGIVLTSEVPDSAENRAESALTFSTAVYDRGLRKRGVLILQFRLKDLLKHARKEKTPLGNTYLLNSRGRLLYRLDIMTGTSGQDTFPERIDQRILKEILSGKEGLITEGKSRIISFEPIVPGFSDPEEFWVLVTSLSRAAVLVPVYRFLFFFGITVAVLTILGILLGVTASHHFTRPILKLHEGARIIATGNFDHRIQVHTHDEIEELAVQFNRMAERLKTSRNRLTQWNEALQKEVRERTDQLFQAEKMAALGGLSAGIAHEIGNPLATVKINIQVLEEQLGRECAHRKLLERIVKEIDRLSRFFKTFSSFAKPARPQLSPCNIRKIIQEVVLFIQPEASSRKIVFEEKFDEPLPNVRVDFQGIQQVFLNLFLNAIQAMPDGGTITVRAFPEEGRKTDFSGDHRVVVTVSDTGMGIPEGLRSKVFEPFFSTKPQGTGLGLSIVHQIVTENHGTITVESTPGGGSIFRIRLEAEKRPVTTDSE